MEILSTIEFKPLAGDHIGNSIEKAVLTCKEYNIKGFMSANGLVIRLDKNSDPEHEYNYYLKWCHGGKNELREDLETLCALHGCKTVSELFRKIDDRIEKLEKQKPLVVMIPDHLDTNVVFNVKSNNGLDVNVVALPTPKNPEPKNDPTLSKTETVEPVDNIDECNHFWVGSYDGDKHLRTYCSKCFAEKPPESEYDRLKRKVEENGGKPIVEGDYIYYIFNKNSGVRWVYKTEIETGVIWWKSRLSEKWNDCDIISIEEIEPKDEEYEEYHKTYHLERIRRGYEEPSENDIEGLRAKAEIVDFELVHKDGTKWVYYKSNYSDTIKKVCLPNGVVWVLVNKEWKNSSIEFSEDVAFDTKAIYRKYAEKEQDEHPRAESGIPLHVEGKKCAFCDWWAKEGNWNGKEAFQEGYCSNPNNLKKGDDKVFRKSVDSCELWCNDIYELDIYFKRLEKYRKVWDIVYPDKKGWAVIPCSDKETCETIERSHYDKFLSHLLELLDSVKNQIKIDSFITKEYPEIFGKIYDSGLGKDIGMKVESFVKADIATITSHLQVPELEVICDLILACQESEE